MDICLVADIGMRSEDSEWRTQLLNRNLPNDPAELVPVLGRLEPGTPVAFEAAYGWGWLAELLGELGLEPHLAHASRCKAIASARRKDDKVDARTLAHLLRAELLPEAWLAPQAVRDQRALLRHRAALVRVATTLKNRVHAILADRGIGVEERLWTTAGRAWLAGLDLPVVQRLIVDDCLGLIDQLTPVVARLDRDLLARATPDPRVQALQVLPGIGQLTAMTLVAEVGGIGRFPTARKLCAWAGLTRRCATPTARSATATSPSRARSPWVRWVLDEAAHKAKTRPPFAHFYAQCAARRGRQIATTAVARKLLARALHVLKEVDPFPAAGEGHPAGCARVTCWACNTAEVLTGQAGPDASVMRILPAREARMGACETSSVDRPCP